ncbi:hypothetical protein [Maledivibacter halophilus]|uniref:OstA-like protein n=1 Tax=Maledivibacter halophilus TaxID=36842 RepID=A0A1T5K3K6_9FIRM|nr:hypothetical protein [Maledivibacter halophilus]SKC58223.1 hypothetical protein SAMN02194393_01591 [Maledivibacter halophilus]
MKKKNIAFIILCIFLINAFSIAYALQPANKRIVEGFYNGIDGEEIEIEGYDGTIHKLSLTEDAIIKIDNREAQLSDFRAGIEVYGELRGWRLRHLEGYSTSNLGYIEEGGKFRSGTIKTIDRNQLTIRLPWGEEQTYYTSESTILLKDNKAVNPDVLYEGDRVKLYFDEINSNIISKMEIQSDSSIKIKELCRGNIKLADPYEDSITLGDVEVFRNGDWETLGDSMTIEYSSDTPIYIGGSKIPPEKLKYYYGKRAYMALKDSFGHNKIEKMVIKNLYERGYSDKIEEINWYTEYLELANNKVNLGFNDGTIIIKSGRMVDKYSLNPDSDALIISDGRNSRSIIDVIYVYNENINNSNIGQAYIYAGELEEITRNKVILDDFFLLEENEWESFGDDKELYYDDDTYIFDLENNEKITAEEFFERDYSVDDDNDDDEDDWYGYIYTDGDRISSILVKEKLDSLNSQRVTNGVVEKVYENSLVGWKIQLRDGRDWSSRKEQWMARGSNLHVLIEDAMIIKDNKMILPEELKPEDRLYLIRKGSKGKIVLVK